MNKLISSTVLLAAIAAPFAAALAEEAARLEEVVVTGREDSLIGVADSASVGVVGREQLALRPLLRPGELLEAMPGLIVSSTAARGRRTSFSSAASISIMARTSPRASTGCR